MKACVPLRLALALALAQPAPEAAWRAAAGFAATGSLLLAGEQAAAKSYSSGGYRKPGGGSGFSRRPSTGGSGGYSRPFGSGSAGTSGFSGGDQSVSRGYSGQALRDFQQQRQAPAAPPWGTGQDRRPSTYGDRPPPNRRPSATYPPPAYPPSGGWTYGGGLPYPGGRSSFGALDAVLLWSLLGALSAPRSTEFFRENRNNPDYLEWREEADRAARKDPALAARLAELDQRLAGSGGGETLEDTRRPSTASEDGTSGSGTILLVVILGAAAFGGLWYMRRRATRSASAAPARPGAGSISGSAASRFRVGMTFPLDPAPFLLAAGVTKAVPPPGEGMVSIEAIGLASDNAVALNRLYLPGRRSFLQLHLAPSGEPDECRYFSQIDEVTPASQDEWGFWLDPAEGMIGWPQFQTKDGKLYDRVWAPGDQRIPPRRLTETIEDASGSRQRGLTAMLYGAPTGAAPPAPDTEYILLQAVQDSGQAWVEFHAGIDVNPASLKLPTVPLPA